MDQAQKRCRANPYHGLNGESFELVNLSETMVQRVLADVLEEQGEKFQINDDLIPVAAALLLNKTKPRYAVTVRVGLTSARPNWIIGCARNDGSSL